MKNITRCFLLVSLLFIFTSCITPVSKGEVENHPNNITYPTNRAVEELVGDINDSPVSKGEVETSSDNVDYPIDKIAKELPNNTNNSNLYAFFSGASNPYTEYIGTLKYIEEIEEVMMSNTVTTAENVDARYDAFYAWDVELNKIYTLLTNKLSAEDMEELRIEQRAWIKERDKSADETAAFYDGGSLSIQVYEYSLFRTTKQRTLELIYIYFDHDNDANSAMEAYREVLLNEAEFFDTFGKKDGCLNEFFKEIYYEHDFSIEEIRSALNFAITDLDEDGIPEIVLSIQEFGNFSEVLRYEDGIVYGYGVFGDRQMGGIKEDGSFDWSGNAGYNGYSKIRFLGISYKFMELASRNSIADQNGDYSETVFLIDNEPTTEAGYDAFIAEQERKKDVIWYAFNDNNIISQITTK